MGLQNHRIQTNGARWKPRQHLIRSARVPVSINLVRMHELRQHCNWVVGPGLRYRAALKRWLDPRPVRPVLVWDPTWLVDHSLLYVFKYSKRMVSEFLKLGVALRATRLVVSSRLLWSLGSQREHGPMTTWRPKLYTSHLLRQQTHKPWGLWTWWRSMSARLGR